MDPPDLEALGSSNSTAQSVHSFKHMLDARRQATTKDIHCARTVRRRGQQGAETETSALTSLEVGGFPEEVVPGLSELEKKVKQGHQAERTAHAMAGSTWHLLVTTKSSSCLERSGRAREIQEASSGGVSEASLRTLGQSL